VAYFDVEVVDDKGRVCPLDYSRIDFEVTGPAEFLGGYNSGVKDLKHDKSYVYAECGTSRVFIRSTREPGQITVTAKREGMKPVTETVSSVPFKIDSTGLTKLTPQGYKVNLLDKAPTLINALEQFKASKAQDKAFKTGEKSSDDSKSEEKIIKVYVNGKEVNFGKGLNAYKMVGAYGPVNPILDTIGASYTFDKTTQKLTVKYGGNVVETTVKDSSMYVNGTQGILNDWPEVIDGILHVEISALIPALKINAYWGTDGNSYYINTK
jgi:beta-galactosidase